MSSNPTAVDTELLGNFNGNAAQPAASAVSWRGIQPIHPAANRIPDPSDEEKRALAADLEHHGQRVPVVLVRVASDPDARLQMLDGRTRLDLLEAGGIKIVNSDGQLLVPHRIVDVQDDAAAEALSLSLNVHRRQLSSKDRRRLIAAEIKADPGQSDRVIAETVKVSPTTVGTVRAEMEAKSEVSKLDTRRDRRATSDQRKGRFAIHRTSRWFETRTAIKSIAG